MSALDRQVATWRDVALLIGRLLIAALFVVSAWQAFNGLAGATGYFARLEVPAPDLVAPAVMVFEFAAGILLVAGFQTRLMALLLGAFTVMAALIGHMNFADGNQLNHFLKNMAIVGGCLAVFVAGAGSYSVDFSRE